MFGFCNIAHCRVIMALESICNFRSYLSPIGRGNLLEEGDDDMAPDVALMGAMRFHVPTNFDVSFSFFNLVIRTGNYCGLTVLSGTL